MYVSHICDLLCARMYVCCVLFLSVCLDCLFTAAFMCEINDIQFAHHWRYFYDAYPICIM